MKKVLMMLADGFEEMEFVVPYDIFLRGGVEVVTASISTQREVASVRNLVVCADDLLAQVNPSAFDVMFLPGGGPGYKNLRQSARVLEFVRNQAKRGGMLAAICGAPLVLGEAGLLQGVQATCFPSCQSELMGMGAKITQDRVCRSGNIWTSRGAGSSAEFSFALLAHLVSQAKANEVHGQMQFA